MCIVTKIQQNKQKYTVTTELFHIDVFIGILESII